MQKKKRIIYEINDEKLHRSLKMLAVKQGRTLKYIIEEAFRDCINKYKNKG